MKKRRIKDEMPVSVAIFFIVTGLIIGTVFIFGNQYWGKSIEREEAISVSAIFDEYKLCYGKYGSISEIKISFADRDFLNVDGMCVSDDVLDGIKALPEGARVDMLVHPNSSTIWELKHGDKTILSFEESQKDIKNENIGFGVLGIFMYFCVALGLGSLVKRWLKARKRNKKRK